MPKENATITLEDENREEYKVNYIVEKSGISGGWKVFTQAHNLREGDVLTFQLVKPSKFKVISNLFLHCVHTQLIIPYSYDLYCSSHHLIYVLVHLTLKKKIIP